jgi:hypothetical protein
VDLLLGGRVDAFAGWLVSDRECPEAEESDLLTLLELGSDYFGEGFYGLTGIDLR